MSAQVLSLTHLVKQPQNTAPSPPLLLLLHGIGSNEMDLYSLAATLDPRFLIVSVRAPITLQPGAYAWFNLAFTEQGPVVTHPQEIIDSRQLLLQFIAEVIEVYQIDPQRVFLMGFSQGAIMSLATVVTEPTQIAGVVAMSGRMVPEAHIPYANPEALVGLPILVTHGVADPVLSIREARECRDRLTQLQIDLTYQEYPMGHQVSDASLRDVQRWLTAQLDALG